MLIEENTSSTTYQPDNTAAMISAYQFSLH